MTNTNFETKDAVLYLYLNHCIEHATAEQRKALETINRENNNSMLDKLIFLFDLRYLKSQLDLLPDLSAIMANMENKCCSIGNSVKECKNDVIPVHVFRWNK